MGQWHDQPEPGRKPTGYSPPISVHFRAGGGSQGFQIKYGRIQRKDPIQIFDAPIQKGKWVDLMFHIRFSQGNDGFLEAWKDGVALTSDRGATRITGPNMYNAEPNYLRLGLYRGKGQTQTNTFYYDEVRIGTTKAAVGREQGGGASGSACACGSAQGPGGLIGSSRAALHPALAGQPRGALPPACPCRAAPGLSAHHPARPMA